MPESSFTFSAPSMVYGDDLIENVLLLSETVGRMEIVLFHTPEIHNLPTAETVRTLTAIREERRLRYTVHLPASFEIAAEGPAQRRCAAEGIHRIVDRCEPLAPDYYILHVPMETPTLTPVPGRYHTSDHRDRMAPWTDRAAESLHGLQRRMDLGRRLLVENINYSPIFLEPFVHMDLCGVCLDIGHLLLGGEQVRRCLQRHLAATREIHLHGVTGWKEHLALDVIPAERVASWVELLRDREFNGILNIEVFDPDHLHRSLAMLREISDRIFQ